MSVLARRKSNVVAIKKVLARGVSQQLKAQGLTVSALAKRMGTSRNAVRRVLDEKNGSITLATAVAAAEAAGLVLHFSVEPRIDRVEAMEIPSALEPLADKLSAALSHVASLPKKGLKIAHA